MTATQGAAVARAIGKGVDMVKAVMKKIDKAGEKVQHDEAKDDSKDRKPDGIDGTVRSVDSNSALSTKNVRDDNVDMTP